MNTVDLSHLTTVYYNRRALEVLKENFAFTDLLQYQHGSEPDEIAEIVSNVFLTEDMIGL